MKQKIQTLYNHIINYRIALLPLQELAQGDLPGLETPWCSVIESLAIAYGINEETLDMIWELAFNGNTQLEIYDSDDNLIDNIYFNNINEFIDYFKNAKFSM